VRQHTLSKPLGVEAIALFLALVAMAVIIVFAQKELSVAIHREPGEAAEAVLGSAIGATVEPLDRATAKGLGIVPYEKGLVITSLARDGPASRAGVRAGDVIERVGPVRIASVDQAAAALKTAQVPIRVILNRRGRYDVVTLPISARGGRVMQQRDER
jgi:S1-C subfamily serine protease